MKSKYHDINENAANYSLAHEVVYPKYNNEAINFMISKYYKITYYMV